MTDIREMKAKDIRNEMDKLAFMIDGYENEYEEYERELERRGLKKHLDL
jgi:hypothetical protein